MSIFKTGDLAEITKLLEHFQAAHEDAYSAIDKIIVPGMRTPLHRPLNNSAKSNLDALGCAHAVQPIGEMAQEPCGLCGIGSMRVK